jgi:hypothetical protein
LVILSCVRLGIRSGTVCCSWKSALRSQDPCF